MKSIYVCDCLIVSFKHAQLDELENALLSCCTQIATGKHSNGLLQYVLEHGSTVFQRRLVERLMENAADVSADQYGNYVIQKCVELDSTGDSELLDMVIKTFQEMSSEQLGPLVRGTFSRFVLQKLLQKGNGPSPQATRELALKMSKLPGDVLGHAESEIVKKSVNKVLRAKAHR